MKTNIMSLHRFHLLDLERERSKNGHNVRINILSSGRFHVCDLARELNILGYDVKFYSFVPVQRTETYGLPRHCSCSLFWALAPYIYLERLEKNKISVFGNIRRWIQDHMTALLMRDADIIIAMSGEFNYSVRKAKQRGARIIIERGSKHILDQQQILAANPFVMASPISPANVKRELLSYDLADYLAVGSTHVADSMINRGVCKKKLFINPYGVETKHFYPVIETKRPYDLIMVGCWCYRKGCDLIVEAIKQTGYSILHVGSLGDIPFPEGDKRFVHIPPVDQQSLNQYYAQARIFILPSREEGLAMVQIQALACGLPIIASVDSGAADLLEIIGDSDSIRIIRDYTVESIVSEINQLLSKYSVKEEGYVVARKKLEQLTWQAYGKRYAQFLKSIM